MVWIGGLDWRQAWSPLEGKCGFHPQPPIHKAKTPNRGKLYPVVFFMSAPETVLARDAAEKEGLDLRTSDAGEAEVTLGFCRKNWHTWVVPVLGLVFVGEPRDILFGGSCLVLKADPRWWLGSPSFENPPFGFHWLKTEQTTNPSFANRHLKSPPPRPPRIGDRVKLGHKRPKVRISLS